MEVGGKLNFEKCRAVAKVLREIWVHKREPFRYEVAPSIRNYILSVEVNPSLADYYDISRYVSPPENGTKPDRPPTLDLISRYR